MHRHRILMRHSPARFNLQPPPDKVPVTDYLLAQNWRVDRVGKLASRFG
jgi:hypothetical protein